MALFPTVAINEVRRILALDPEEAAILTKWNMVVKCLLDAGVACMRKVHPSELFCHPRNRGGLGLNHYNVHKNMRIIAHIGADESQLAGHACFEISTKEHIRDMQIAFNLRLIKQAAGLLAGPTGKERYLTVGGGHTGAGCRAIIYNCKSGVEKLIDNTGRFSYEKATKRDAVFKQMLDEGWTFIIIPAFVEEEFPELPHLGQQALNASNNVSSETSELETATTIAEYAEQDRRMGVEADYSMYVEAAKASAPPCESYIETIGRYVKAYGGGPGAPLIHFIDHVAKTYGANKRLGEDFFTAVTDLVIPSDDTKYPFLRTSCITCNLVSTKVQDGVARFLLPSNVESLKSKKLQAKVASAEKALVDQWALTNIRILTNQIDKAVAFKIFGALSARTCMFVLGNGKAGFEQCNYPSMEQLIEDYTAKLEVACGNEAPPAKEHAHENAASSSGPPQSQLATVSEVSDPKWIAEQRGYAEGSHYTMSGNLRIFKLESFGAETVRFSEETVVGEAAELDVPYGELKAWSPFKGNLPVLINPIKVYGSANEKLHVEAKRAKVFHRIVAVAESHSQHETQTVFSLFPSIVRTKEACAVGKLRLVPFTDSISKVIVGKKVGMIAEVEFGGVRYSIEAPTKPNIEDETKWATSSLLCAFFWVVPSHNKEDANMEIKEEKHDDIKITIMRNSKKLAMDDKLVRYVPKAVKAKASEPDKFVVVKPPAEIEEELVEEKPPTKKARAAKKG